jgi:hypothetical protein
VPGSPQQLARIRNLDVQPVTPAEWEGLWENPSASVESGKNCAPSGLWCGQSTNRFEG